MEIDSCFLAPVRAEIVENWLFLQCVYKDWYCRTDFLNSAFLQISCISFSCALHANLDCTAHCFQLDWPAITVATGWPVMNKLRFEFHRSISTHCGTQDNWIPEWKYPSHWLQCNNRVHQQRLKCVWKQSLAVLDTILSQPHIKSFTRLRRS